MAIVTEIFPDFASALAACGAGYNDADLADVIAYKTRAPIDNRNFVPEQASNSILAVSAAAAEVAHRPLTVLDFGGGCGFHYFWTAAALRTPLRWAIVETPIMADRAAKIAQGRFEVFTDIATAASALGGIDLVHASSAIQYVPDPLGTLRALAAIQARYVAIARFPVWTGATIVGLQRSFLSVNGLGLMPRHIADREVKYPVTFVNIDQVLRIWGGYEVMLMIHSITSRYEVSGKQVDGISIVFRSKSVSPEAAAWRK